MRFHANGPDIPGDLLNARDKGKVVFICGAGVSVPAGLPNFVQLTRLVLKKLQEPPKSEISQAFEYWEDDNLDASAKLPLDRIFQMLHEKYRREQVNHAVTDALTLCINEEPDLHYHKVVTRISRSQDNRVQIVTTNFDTLFEKLPDIEKASPFEPPILPNLELGQPPTGITYLHGRMAENHKHIPDYILSTSDLGRAYLAEAWATNFVRRLLRDYIVVFLGYKADDPPMDSLLRALQHSDYPKKNDIYAFDQKPTDAVRAQWISKGIRLIEYPIDHTNPHTPLWASLERWADRADDPYTWRRNIATMAARKNPKELEPHERGQVHHVVSSMAGAQEFLRTEPMPAPEWLCVFDQGIRQKRRIGNAHEHLTGQIRGPYALDSDPVPLPSRKPSHSSTAVRSPQLSEIAEPISLLRMESEALGMTLSPLDSWISRSAHRPLVAWWAAQRLPLPPHLAVEIFRRIDSFRATDPKCGRIWDWILSAQADSSHPIESIRAEDHSFRGDIDAWSATDFRTFEHCIGPAIQIRNSSIGETPPPTQDWDVTNVDEVTQFELSFPRFPLDTMTIPESAVVDAVFTASHCLAQYSLLIEEIGIRQPSLSRVDLIDNLRRRRRTYTPRGGVLAFLPWFSTQVIRAFRVEPERVAAAIFSWPVDRYSIFFKLRLFATATLDIGCSAKLERHVIRVPSELFWSSDTRKELLHFLAARWSDFSRQGRETLCERILPVGLDSGRDESERERVQFRGAKILTWLRNRGCRLPESCVGRLVATTSALSEWNDELAESADDVFRVRGHLVKIDQTPSVLDGVVDEEIIEVCERHAGSRGRGPVEVRPFEGLVKRDPARAVGAICSVLDRGQYLRSYYWEKLAELFPGEHSANAVEILVAAISRVPTAVFRRQEVALSLLLERLFRGTWRSDVDLALRLIDVVVDRIFPRELCAEGTQASSPSEATPRDPGRGAPFEDLAGSVGSAVVSAIVAGLALFCSTHRESERKHLFRQLARVLRPCGKLRRDSTFGVCCHLPELFDLDRDWCNDAVGPLLAREGECVREAWFGFFSTNGCIGVEVFEWIKNDLFSLLSQVFEWGFDYTTLENVCNILVRSLFDRSASDDHTSHRELADACRGLPPHGRVCVLDTLLEYASSTEDSWSDVILPFMEYWPKDDAFQTEDTSQAIFRLLEVSGSHLPHLLSTVKFHLRPFNHYNRFAFVGSEGPDSHVPNVQDNPIGVLDVLDRVTGVHVEHAPKNLAPLLEALECNHPGISGRKEFFRLRDLTRAR